MTEKEGVQESKGVTEIKRGNKRKRERERESERKKARDREELLTPPCVVLCRSARLHGTHHNCTLV